jgi:hypothetical protein
MVRRSVGAALAVAGAVSLLPGCETRPPASDALPPEVTVTVSQGRGGNVFRSSDGVPPPGEDCIEVPPPPVGLALIVGDSGGVLEAGLRVTGGTIRRESIEVTPAAPEATVSVAADRGSDLLRIQLTRPSPDTVRTGASAIVQVDGTLPISVVAWARDYAGNYGELAQVDLRLLGDPTVCRGDG